MIDATVRDPEAHTHIHQPENYINSSPSTPGLTHPLAPAGERADRKPRAKVWVLCESRDRIVSGVGEGWSEDGG